MTLATRATPTPRHIGVIRNNDTAAEPTHRYDWDGHPVDLVHIGYVRYDEDGSRRYDDVFMIPASVTATFTGDLEDAAVAGRIYVIPRESPVLHRIPQADPFAGLEDEDSRGGLIEA